MRLASLALALLIGAPATAVAVPNLLTNGNFLTFTTTGAPHGGGDNTIGGMPNYNIMVSGWTNAPYSGTTLGYNFLYGADANSLPTGSGSGSYADNGGANGYDGAMQLYGPGNSNGTGPANGLSAPTAAMGGGNIMAMDGAYNVGALYQTVQNLLVGTVYHVTFFYGAAQQSGFTGATTEKFNVDVCTTTTYACASGDSSYTASYTTPTLNNPYEGFTGWDLATFTFIATNAEETLSFLAAGTPNGQPPFSLLADVMLTVPEPPALGLFGLGVAGIVALRLRRMAKDRAAAV